MKLTLAAAVAQALFAISNAAAVPAENAVELSARASCTLYAHWTTNWSEAGLRRYQVKLGQDPGDNNGYVARYCDIMRNNMGLTSSNNFQCYWHFGQNSYVADASFIEGSAGHDAYVDTFQRGLNVFRDATQCDVNSSL